MARFSIIIPCFNAARWIEATIGSCLGQTCRDLEVIVVDDGSTDGSGQVAEAMAARDGRVRVLRQGNRGLGAARNSGIKAASGEYLNFLDADDLLEPEKLERQGTVLDRNPDLEMVLCDGWRIDADGSVVENGLLERRRFGGLPSLFELLFSGGQFPPLVPLIRRRLVDAVGGFEVDRRAAGWADTGFWLRAALSGARYAIVCERLCRYRVHQSAMSADLGAMEEAAQLIYARLMAEHPTECARSLRATQRRLAECEAAAAALRMAVGASEASRSALADELAALRALRDADAERREAEVLKRMLAFLGAQSGAQARRKVYIWGAGSGGRRVLDLLRRSGAEADGFIDSDPRKTGLIVDGVVVLGSDVFCGESAVRPFVLVASQYCDEIVIRIKRLGMIDGRDFLAVDFRVVAALEAG
ncbi:MAG: glycosyltransferase [Opitutaceae bacterium]|nr:glycosyltransferase [Opitutaceae bacterium]